MADDARSRLAKAIRDAERELGDAGIAIDEAMSAVRGIGDSVGLPDGGFMADLHSLLDDVDRDSVLAPRSPQDMAAAIRELIRRNE